MGRMHLTSDVVEAHSCVGDDSKFYLMSNTQLVVNTQWYRAFQPEGLVVYCSSSEILLSHLSILHQNVVALVCRCTFGPC